MLRGQRAKGAFHPVSSFAGDDGSIKIASGIEQSQIIRRDLAKPALAKAPDGGAEMPVGDDVDEAGKAVGLARIPIYNGSNGR